jgi:N-acetyl-anhydromuramyl-L-alanine amidase AmpD
MAVIALTGCQTDQPVALVKNLPPPNFDGPANLNAPPAAPAPIAPAMPPVAVAPRAAIPRNPALDVPREWVPPIRANAWRWIIIHHSATATGGAAAFNQMHKDKGWDELGYHFVIGNGSDTRDGQVEVGPRWRKQKWGAHAKTPDNKYNDFGIGVCLVGHFDVTRPSWKQIDATSKLVAHLQRTYNVPPERVIGHGMVHTFDAAGTATKCPGRHVSIAQIRQLSGRILAEAQRDAGEANPAAAHASAVAGSPTELLYDATAAAATSSR